MFGLPNLYWITPKRKKMSAKEQIKGRKIPLARNRIALDKSKVVTKKHCKVHKVFA